ncbi:MAG: peptidyl-prolyl cis-trans isomerase [Acidobacteriia bacterium]|nr:peptidyl-prolyl cis-trans isomerase [Terriglobia bacterium]
MKRIPVLVLAVLLASLGARAGERRLVEGIVVRVNDRILTTADIRERANEQAAETGRTLTPEQYTELIQHAADEMCMLERAEELKLEVSSDELNSAIRTIREQNHTPDDAAFEAQLRNMGMTVEALRARVHDSILVNRLLHREVGDLPITEEELRQRFEREKEQFTIGERVHLEHIVYSVGPEKGDEQAELAAARRLVAAVRSGGEFKTLVQQEVDTGRATGGDLGTVLTTDMRAEVRDAVAKLKPGGVSDPFMSSAGVHVVRLVERIPPTLKPFGDVEEALREREFEERSQAKFTNVVSEVKKRYVVEIHPELMTGSR